MSKGQRSVRFKWFVTLLGVLLLPVLVGLGIWQLDRAEQKKLLIQQREAQVGYLSQLPPTLIASGTGVRLAGEFDAQRWFLLDNRVREGRVGYEVLVLFYPAEGGEVLLINLGWIAADVDRAILPKVLLPSGPLVLRGHLVQPSDGLQLAADSWALSWPKRIQQIDIPRLQSHLQQMLYPAVLQVAEPLIPELKVGWSVVNMPPEKHLGYALQWFALAFVLAIGMVWLGWQEFHQARRQEVL